jgi:hypothetical protein
MNMIMLDSRRFEKFRAVLYRKIHTRTWLTRRDRSLWNFFSIFSLYRTDNCLLLRVRLRVAIKYNLHRSEMTIRSKISE